VSGRANFVMADVSFRLGNGARRNTIGVQAAFREAGGDRGGAVIGAELGVDVQQERCRWVR
jgi:hypothetical protein